MCVFVCVLPFISVNYTELWHMAHVKKYPRIVIALFIRLFSSVWIFQFVCLNQYSHMAQYTIRIIDKKIDSRLNIGQRTTTKSNVNFFAQEHNSNTEKKKL